ncbi:hypothetical protein FRC12_012997 [Ceratobasidium sp. 428]|nr:hypothetical protein FRC12_012997 [Ceratobasidium sp. 428]
MPVARMRPWPFSGPALDVQELIQYQTQYDRQLIDEYLHHFAPGRKYRDRPAVPTDHVPAGVARRDLLWETNREALHEDLKMLLWGSHITAGLLSVMEMLRVWQFNREARALRDTSSTPSLQDDEDAVPSSVIDLTGLSDDEDQGSVVADAGPETPSEALPEAGPEEGYNEVQFLGCGPDAPANVDKEVVILSHIIPANRRAPTVSGSSDHRARSGDGRPAKRPRIELPRTADGPGQYILY